MKNLKFESLLMDGFFHNIACLKYDGRGRILYAIGSFYSRQLFDNCIALLQKGTSCKLNGKYLYASRKGYTSKVLRVQDENTGDGVHAVISSISENILKVYKDEKEEDIIYNFLEKNIKSGLIPEWKEYLAKRLKERNLIDTAEGFDYTSSAPTILIISKDVTTELIRDIKQEGLKNGDISIPTNVVTKLNQDMSFLNIIEDLVLPNIKSQECHYNIGNPISSYLKSRILTKNNKEVMLYPRQMIIGQGMINSIKNGNPHQILNGGCGVGKTYLSILTAYTLMKEYFVKDNFRVILYLQSHLINKWMRQFEECLNPVGIEPKFFKISHFKDIEKLSKQPNGFEVIIFPKDMSKRSYLNDFSATNLKFRDLDRTIMPFINDYDDYEDTVLLVDASKFNINKFKLIAKRLEFRLGKKIALYQKNETGFKIFTTSDILKSHFGTKNKAYDFEVDNLDIVKDFIDKNFDDLDSEDINIYDEPHLKIDNYLTCPCCGGRLYDNANYIFDEEKMNKFYTTTPNSRNSYNNKCNCYIKADGTPLTSLELKYLRNGKISYKVVTEKLKYAYVDEDGSPLQGNELNRAKQLKGDFTLLLKKCDYKLWGAVRTKGYNTMNSAAWLMKKFGKNMADIGIFDEFHLHASPSSLQGLNYQTLVKACKTSLNLSGSISGGKASDLFYLLYRLTPQRMIKNGYKYSEVGKFIDHFGRRKRVTKDTTSISNFTKSGKGKIIKGSWVEIPGISSLLYTLFLNPIMASRTIDDMGFKLPTLKFFRHAVDMDDDIKEEYDNLKNQLISFMKNNRGINIGGAYIHSLLSYPDNPIETEILAMKSLFVARSKTIDIENRITNKEQKLLDTIHRELSEDRRVLLYSEYSGTKGVSKRLVKVLTENGIKVAELKSSIKLEKREQWIEDRYNEGIEVILCNPALVETGLDIIHYPTIYFYEQTFNIKRLRQAECRAYRPNATTDECRVFYSYYKDSLQEDALKLISSKKRSSLALEGIFSEDCLSAMSEGGDTIATTLNKVLEGKVSIDENLDSFDFYSDESLITSPQKEPVIIENVVEEVIISSESQVTENETIIGIYKQIDTDYMKKVSKKISKRVVEGQLGFIF